MPRGKKECKSCGELVGSRAPTCSCGYIFPKARPKKKAKPFFKERKNFIKRMLSGAKSDNMALDLKVATKIFDDFDNDIEFLNSVAPPFKLDNNIRYLRSKDGSKYLKRKKLDFDYIPPDIVEIVEHEDKAGKDIILAKNKTLREFLNNE